MKKEVLLATCFGLGKLPWAPETWASLPPVVTYQVLGYLGPVWNVYAMGFFIVFGSTVHLLYAASAKRSLSPEKQRQVVTDKLAGQGLTMLIITLLHPLEICNAMACGFALFRLTDFTATSLLKNRFCGHCEKKDLLFSLAAGLIAGVISAIAIYMLPACFG